MASLDFANPKAEIAVCTFWTERRKAAAAMDPASYAMIGNLYSSNGINFLLKTLLANPNVRTLVLCGYCLSKADADLIRLFKSGVVGGRIPDTKVSMLVDSGQVDLLRRNVEIVDMRKMPLDAVAERVAGLGALKKGPWGKPVAVSLFEEEPAETAPSPLSGHHIYDTSVFYAWVKLLAYALKFGQVKMTEYEDEQKEYNNIMVTIGQNHEFVEMPMREYCPQDEVSEYFERNLLFGIDPEEMGVAYTYGQRLFSYKGSIDQVAFIVDKLGRTPFSRRAVAVLWDPATDEVDEHAPCLDFISCNIHGDEVYMTALFRSHDLYGAWPKNVLGLMRLQKWITDAINGKFGTAYKAGKITVISVSAHIYRRDFAAARGIVERDLAHANRLIIDPKGLFVVRIEEGRIVVEYRSNEGELVETFSGESGEQLYKKIANSDIFSFFVHSAYLGYQIAKAEYCMQNGIPFVQDRAPE